MTTPSESDDDAVLRMLAAMQQSETFTAALVAAGLDPHRDPPPSIAHVIERLGRATYVACGRAEWNPDALHWLAISYAHLAAVLFDVAGAVQEDRADAVTRAAEALLRDSPPSG